MTVSAMTGIDRNPQSGKHGIARDKNGRSPNFDSHSCPGIIDVVPPMRVREPNKQAVMIGGDLPACDVFNSFCRKIISDPVRVGSGSVYIHSKNVRIRQLLAGIRKFFAKIQSHKIKIGMPGNGNSAGGGVRLRGAGRKKFCKFLRKPSLQCLRQLNAILRTALSRNDEPYARLEKSEFLTAKPVRTETCIDKRSLSRELCDTGKFFRQDGNFSF